MKITLLFLLPLIIFLLGFILYHFLSEFIDPNPVGLQGKSLLFTSLCVLLVALDILSHAHGFLSWGLYTLSGIFLCIAMKYRYFDAHFATYIHPTSEFFCSIFSIVLGIFTLATPSATHFYNIALLTTEGHWLLGVSLIFVGIILIVFEYNAGRLSIRKRKKAASNK